MPYRNVCNPIIFILIRDTPASALTHLIEMRYMLIRADTITVADFLRDNQVLINPLAEV